MCFVVKVRLVCILANINQKYLWVQTVAYPRGEWGGPDPPTFQKVGPRDSHKNVIRLMGGGGDRPIGHICEEVFSEILENQAENGFFKNW